MKAMPPSHLFVLFVQVVNMQAPMVTLSVKSVPRGSCQIRAEQHVLIAKVFVSLFYFRNTLIIAPFLYVSKQNKMQNLVFFSFFTLSLSTFLFSFFHYFLKNKK
jgi:hypothetical protein